MRLSLPPGPYVLFPRSSGPNGSTGSGRPVRVRVKEDRYTPVTVLYRLHVAGSPARLR
jgi:hypothetical protein